MTTRSSVLIRNTLYNFVTQIYSILLAFVTLPYIVNTLGVSAYGVLTITLVIIGYLYFLDFGLSVAVEKSLSEWAAKGASDKLRRDIGTGLFSCSILGVGGGFILWVSAGWLVQHVFTIPPPLLDPAKTVLRLAALAFVIEMPQSIFAAAVRARGRFDLLNRLLWMVSSIRTLGSVALLAVGYHLQAVMMLYVGVDLFYLLALWATVRIQLPEIHLSLIPDWEAAKSLFQTGGFLALGRAASTLAVEIDKVLLGVLMPISQLTFYQIPYGLSQRALTLAPNITSAIFPVFAQLHSTGQMELFRSLYARASRYLLTAVFPFAAILFLFAPDIMRFWMGETFVASATWPLRILSLGVLVNAATWVPARAAVAAGEAKVVTALNGAQGATAIVLCVTLIPFYGTVGAALAWTLRDIVAAPYFLHHINRRIAKVSNRAFLLDAYGRWAFFGLFFLLIFAVLSPVPTGLVHLIAMSLLLIGVYFGLAYLCIFDRQDREWFEAFMRNRLRQYPFVKQWLVAGEASASSLPVLLRKKTATPFKVENISFYTLSCDRLHYTQRMIESLAQSARERYQHVIVDQGSRDDTVKFLKSLPRLYPHIEWKLIFLAKNVGIIQGQILALEQCTGDLLVKIDNDCRVMTQDIDLHLKTLYALTGPGYALSPFPAGLISHRGGPPRIGYEVYYSEERDCYYTLGLTSHVGGLFRAVPRPVLEKAGGWEDYYRENPGEDLHSHEDSYFSQRALRSGFKLAYIENECVVEHQESTHGQHVRYGSEYFGNKF